MRDIQAFRHLARNGLQTIPTDMLRNYYRAVDNEIKAYEALSGRTNEDYTDIIEDLDIERSDIIREGQSRQAEEQIIGEAEKSQPKEAPAVSPEQTEARSTPQKTTDQPAEKVATPTQQEYTESTTKNAEGAKQNDSNRRDANNDQRNVRGQAGMGQPNQLGVRHEPGVQNGQQERPEGDRTSEARDTNREGDSAERRVDSRNMEVEPGDGGHRGVQQSVSEEANGRNVTKQK